MILPDDDIRDFVIGGPQRGPNYVMGASSPKEQAVSDPATESFYANVDKLSAVNLDENDRAIRLLWWRLAWQARDAEVARLREALESIAKPYMRIDSTEFGLGQNRGKELAAKEARDALAANPTSERVVPSIMQLQSIIEPIIANRIEHESAQGVECPVCFLGQEISDAIHALLQRKGGR